jgi:hypothetical protein
LKEFGAAIAADSPLQDNLKTLQKNIVERKWVAEAMLVANEPVPAAKDVLPVQTEVRDPLERFDAIGWLRWQRGITGPGQYVIEKGGQTLYVVTCRSNRYELGLFVDREIGLVGPRRRPGVESLRVLDVEKIEVLGLPR